MKEQKVVDLGKARKIIEKGGLVVYPTETAYGIATDPLDPEAVRKVYAAKQRPLEKGLTVIAHDIEQVEEIAYLTDGERKIVDEFMPGPVTLVVKKNEKVPDILNKDLAFRIPGSETARNLAEKGPITATSANISGERTSYAVDEISRELLKEVDGLIDEGQLEDGPTSTIAEVKNSDIVVHREGPVDKKDLKRVLKHGSDDSR